MDLSVSLSQKEETWINGDHPVFIDSEYEDFDFGIKIKPLTRTEMSKLRRESVTKKNKKVDDDIYISKIFMNQVIGWDLKDENGKSIPFNEENKKSLLEMMPVFTNLIAAACLYDHAKATEEKEEEIKNS